MTNVKCRVKSCAVCDDNKLHLHHVKPRAIGGTDADGRIRLCEKHHNILHQLLLKEVWKFVHRKERILAEEHIRNYTKWYCEKFG